MGELVGLAPGGKKTGGRTKGIPNKKTILLEELCEKRKIHPFEALLTLCSHPDPSIQLGAIKEACSYLYPKRKAIEHSEDPNNYPGKAKEESRLVELRAAVQARINERK